MKGIQAAEETQGVQPGSPSRFEAVRKPNAILTTTGGPGGGSVQKQTISSPTHFLSGKRGSSSDFFSQGDNTKEQLEGEMIRMANENKFKTYWYCLLGKELYV